MFTVYLLGETLFGDCLLVTMVTMLLGMVTMLISCYHGYHVTKPVGHFWCKYNSVAGLTIIESNEDPFDQVVKF